MFCMVEFDDIVRSRDESDLFKHHAGGLTEGLLLQSCDQERHCGGSGSHCHLPQCQPYPHLPQTAGLLLLPQANACINMTYNQYITCITESISTVPLM